MRRLVVGVFSSFFVAFPHGMLSADPRLPDAYEVVGVQELYAVAGFFPKESSVRAGESHFFLGAVVSCERLEIFIRKPYQTIAIKDPIRPEISSQWLEMSKSRTFSADVTQADACYAAEGNSFFPPAPIVIFLGLLKPTRRTALGWVVEVDQIFFSGQFAESAWDPREEVTYEDVVTSLAEIGLQFLLRNR